MIYLFCGSDTHAARTKAFSWVAATRKKAPNAPYIKLSGSEITSKSLNDAVVSRGLFFDKTLILLDAPFENKEIGDVVLGARTFLKETENPVAIIAPALSQAIQKKLELVAERVFVCDIKIKPKERGFNTALVAALTSRNGEALWLELQKAYRLKDAPEMLHGLLHWKARDLMKKGEGKWKEEETRALSLSLIELVSDSRKGTLPLSENLERFALLLNK